MSASDMKVGEVVLVNKKHKAVIKYIGETSFKDGIWYGVELEKEKGKHNGTVCREKRGRGGEAKCVGRCSSLRFNAGVLGEGGVFASVYMFVRSSLFPTLCRFTITHILLPSRGMVPLYLVLI